MPAQSPVTAIDILLEPDGIMLRHAEANNARLLKVFPKGFALDEAHRPHITLIQRFVCTEALDQVYGAAEKVLGGADVTAAMVLGESWIEVPQAIAVDYLGAPRFGIGIGRDHRDDARAPAYGGQPRGRWVSLQPVPA